MPILMPPPQYDRPPEIPVIEHVLTSDAINRICHERHAMDMAGRPASPAYRFSGCAHISVTSNGKSCEVWRIDDGTVRRHEYGHCNGWPADHPDAAETARRLAADRAAHHREIEKDAAANAAADRAAAIAPLSPAPPPHVDLIADAIRRTPPPTVRVPTVPLSPLGSAPVVTPWPIRDAQQQPEGRSALDAIGDGEHVPQTRRNRHA